MSSLLPLPSSCRVQVPMWTRSRGVLCTITRAAAVVYRGPTDLRSISSVRPKQPHHALVLPRRVASKFSVRPFRLFRVCFDMVGMVDGRVVTAAMSFC